MDASGNREDNDRRDHRFAEANEVNDITSQQFENVLDADFNPLPSTRNQRHGSHIISFQGIKFDLTQSRSNPISELRDSATEEYGNLLSFLGNLDKQGLLEGDCKPG